MANVEDNSRVCLDGGLLAGSLVRVPEDERYFQSAGAKFLVGCNRLRCTLCGEMARQQIGFRDGEGASEHAREIYEAAEFGESPYMIADPESRTYACACSVVVLKGDKACPFPNGTWTCAGHPPVDGGATVLPGMTLDAANNFALMIMNSHIQEAINVVAITFVDGDGIVATPARVSLGEGWPLLKLWTDETVNTPVDVDFSNVAGGCVQLKDETLWTY